MDEVQRKYDEYSREIERLQEPGSQTEMAWFYAIRIKVLIYIRDRYFGPRRYSQPILVQPIKSLRSAPHRRVVIRQPRRVMTTEKIRNLVNSIHEAALERDVRPVE